MRGSQILGGPAIQCPIDMFHGHRGLMNFARSRADARGLRQRVRLIETPDDPIKKWWVIEDAVPEVSKVKRRKMSYK